MFMHVHVCTAVSVYLCAAGCACGCAHVHRGPRAHAVCVCACACWGVRGRACPVEGVPARGRDVGLRRPSTVPSHPNRPVGPWQWECAQPPPWQETPAGGHGHSSANPTRTRPVPVSATIKPEKLQNLCRDTHPAGRAPGELPRWLQAAEVSPGWDVFSRAELCQRQTLEDHRSRSFTGSPPPPYPL